QFRQWNVCWLNSELCKTSKVAYSS
ncbi:hypothetical protein V3C99_015801, partial [Haemonchus contortus]